MGSQRDWPHSSMRNTRIVPLRGELRWLLGQSPRRRKTCGNLPSTPHTWGAAIHRGHSRRGGCPPPCDCRSNWRLCYRASAMGLDQPLDRRTGLALVPAVAVVTTTLSGQLRITCANPNYNFATRTNKRENRVFPIFSPELDGGYSKIQSSGQLPGSKCFMGRLLEKALLVFVKSQLDDCGDLSVAVGGSNWDILGGNVKRIEVSVKQAIYKGVVLSEVGLAASNVRAELGRNRLFHQPFNVNARIRIREQDLNTSLTSPVMSSSFKDILPAEFQPLQVLYDNGNLRFSRSDKQSGRYDEIEYPIILKVDVEKGGEVISVKTSKTGSPEKAFKVGPDVKITDFQVGSSWLSLTGEFLFMP